MKLYRHHCDCGCTLVAAIMRDKTASGGWGIVFAHEPGTHTAALSVASGHCPSCQRPIDCRCGLDGRTLVLVTTAWEPWDPKPVHRPKSAKQA